MEAVKTRAAERYKADYKVWKGIHDWLYSKSNEPINQPGITPEAIKILEKARLLKRRQQLLERSPIPPPTDPEEFDGLNFIFCPIYDFLKHLKIFSRVREGERTNSSATQQETSDFLVVVKRFRKVDNTYITTSQRPFEVCDQHGAPILFSYDIP
jgi:hypothetical protein